MVDVAEIAAAVCAHPAVARLDGGPFGAVASLLPGRRVEGVRVGADNDPVELAVIARLGTPLPQVGAELGEIVQRLCGPVPVEVTFSDVEIDPPAGPATPAAVEAGRPRPPGGRRGPLPLA